MGANKKTFGTRTEFSTARAGLGSHKWVDFNSLDSSLQSFIFNKTLQLEETPTIQPKIHSLSSPHLSYSFEVFQNNSSSVAVINNLSAYVMIYPSLEPLLFSRQFFKQFSGTPSAFCLKFCSQPFEVKHFSLDLLSTEKFPVACYSNMVYADINTKNSVLEARVFCADVFSKSKKEEASSLPVNSQQTFFDIPTEIFFIAVRDGEWNLDSALDCSQTQNIIFERSTAREIVSDGNSINNWFSFGFLDNSTSLFDTRTSQLTLQSTFFEMFVNKGMELEVIANLSLPSLIDTELQSFPINFDSFDYLRSCGNLDFCGCSCFHNLNIGSQVFKPYADICPVINKNEVKCNSSQQ